MASEQKSQLLIDYDGQEGLRTLSCKEFLTGYGDLSRPLSSYHVDSLEWA